jgi:hypothetical protein
MGLRPKGIAGTYDIFGLSENLWGNAPIDYILGFHERDDGWAVFDDFKNFGIGGPALASAVGYYQSEGNSYRSYECVGGLYTSGHNIVHDNTRYSIPAAYPIQLANAGNIPSGGQAIQYGYPTQLWTPGQLKFGSASTTTADQASLQMGPITSALNVCPFSVVPGYSGTLLFECRLKIHTGIGPASGSTGTGFFIGLVAEGAAVQNIPVSVSAFDATLHKIGFGVRPVTDTLNTLQTVYGRTTIKEIGTPLLTLGSFPNSTYPTVGLDAYFKLGFRYEGKSQRFTPFINGIAQDGQTSATNQTIGKGTLLGVANTDYGTDGAYWPSNPMTLCAGLCHYGALGTFPSVTLDWWGAAQEPAIGAWGKP